MVPSIARASGALLLLGSAFGTLDTFDYDYPANTLGYDYDGFEDLSPDAAFIDKRAVAPGISIKTPSPWIYQGCYTDANPRTLSGASYIDTKAMTVESCIAFCGASYWIYAGLEYMQECYCGNSTSAGTVSTGCTQACQGMSSEACGGNNRLSVYWNQVPSPGGPWTNPGTLGYGFYGCYTEGSGGRALANGKTVTGSMTVVKCIAACQAAGYSLAGVEYAAECYCDNSFMNTPTIAPGGLSDCNMPCKGNTSEYCGAGNRLDVYNLGYSPTSATSTTQPSVPSSATTSSSVPTTLKGQQTSNSSSSSSPGSPSSLSSSSSSPSLTTSSSTSLSSAGSSSFNTPSLSSSSSSSPSPAAPTTISGDMITTKIAPMMAYPSNSDSSSSSTSSSISSLSSSSSSSQISAVPTITPATSTTSSSPSTSISPTLGIRPTIGAYTAMGCYTEATNTRALTGATYYTTPMTLELCAKSCAGFTYWGVEYGQECYCGNTVNAGSVLANLADCSFTCPGDATEYCGAGNRLQMYKLTSAATSSGTSALGSSSVAAITTTSSAPTSTITGLPAGWKYAGCYTDPPGRALSNQLSGGNSNTVENCIAACIAAGYSVAGMEYSSQCFCDNSLKNGASLAASESQCNIACSGNSQEMCGAGNILSLYYTGNLTVYQPPKVQTDNLPGSWTYQGCYSDTLNGARALTWQIILANNNTATSCLSLCSSFGYMAAGMEYGRECYCGDDDKRIATGSVQQDPSGCNVACTGDPTYLCGGGGRLSYYTWTGTPLYKWNYPTGKAMGSYEFLIGGVVVPLMTTPGINNKIVFLEKSGTGPPNTTGTYELDLAFLNDFSKAWRPLHLKTDVFCSAGITLPDKVGRQLNIGGWSGASTYGVRLYWPDGSPGVPGVRDWQENVKELSLLAGRWYPSAMIMANGSILVVGGETGSNASPTPSLELLPLPAGGYEKYCDWLDRTDPYNLYPFLFVLPTGGVLALYYNEARILDEVTLDTAKTLPNMPGTVISFLSGRTYPLEGTAVLLPQYPPYSDPVTVLVCGGSTAGAGQAIDNCVSTQPELASPRWALERMPSARVLVCMTPLPDGTYMILNGAVSGVGGFGLAQNPNLGALLYDPTQPIGQRISVMATTIVARLYHSEAILLPDGRVLVSGSDPEDGVNPQEYRVEVFNPPYILSGATPPSYTITNKDWTYGSSVTITANIPSGNLGAVRVSMMGSVTSTHGNSMGARTLFLSVKCTGSANAATCTLVAPPTAHVCPPGWYQLFILDGGRPGTAIYVRIGGSIADAAGLGNWPPYSEFSTPGLGAVGS